MSNPPVMRRDADKISEANDNRSSVLLGNDQVEELRNKFVKLDTDGNGYIDNFDLRDALKSVGIDKPNYEIRDLIDKLKKSDLNKDGKISLEEFKEMYTNFKSDNPFRNFKKQTLKEAVNVDKKHSDTSVHTIRHSERFAFTKWINQNLANDADLKLAQNPIDPNSEHELYKRCENGILLCKLVNLSVPQTIDERTINRGKTTIHHELENLVLAINSAEGIGCSIINISPTAIREGKEYLIMGLMWQIIQIGLFAEINLKNHPGLLFLLKEDEVKEDLLKLSKEALLLRWFNYHLQKSDYNGKEIKNFSSDISDSVAYTYLLYQISPKGQNPPVSLAPLNENDLTRRAEKMLNEADKLKVKDFISANDVITGHPKLNMAFVANLFNTYPALETPEHVENIEEIEETREEKTFRNWMNALGVNPRVNYLFTDLQDALIIFQLYDMIKSGIVDWSKVIKTFKSLRIKFEKLSNCNYAIDIGKKLDFRLVGIQGSNILDGDKTFTLALIWQLMRAYTLAMLQKLTGEGHPIVESGIIEWANKKLKDAGKKSSIASFQDSSISDSRAICDLIEAIKPQSIKYENLKNSSNVEDKMDNARYAIGIARKIGARVFALPEDIVEVKPKMVMTVFATLMIRDFQPKH